MYGVGLIKFQQLANLVWKKSLLISTFEHPVVCPVCYSQFEPLSESLEALTHRVLKGLILTFAEGSQLFPCKYLLKLD